MAHATNPSDRYQSLDYWRGIFCILVVLEHAAIAVQRWLSETTGFERQALEWMLRPLCWNLGAPLFFVVSGYCVAASIDRFRRQDRSPWEFLARRCWRIYPPYWAALGVYVLTVLVLDALGLEHWHRNGLTLELYGPRELNGLQWLGNFTLSETWRPHVLGHDTLIYSRVGWSLCYQEQFYLICFLLLLNFRHRYFESLAVATGAILVFAALAWDIGASHRLTGTFPELWHEFAIGLAVYWRLNYPGTALARRGIELAILGILAVALLQGLTTTIGAGTLGLLLIGLRPCDGWLASQRWLSPLRTFGRYSYSIYLTHLPICALVLSALDAVAVPGPWFRLLVMVPAATLASLAFGRTFHRCVDSRFTQLPNLRQLFSWKSRPATLPVEAAAG